MIRRGIGRYVKRAVHRRCRRIELRHRRRAQHQLHRAEHRRRRIVRVVDARVPRVGAKRRARRCAACCHRSQTVCVSRWTIPGRSTLALSRRCPRHARCRVGRHTLCERPDQRRRTRTNRCDCLLMIVFERIRPGVSRCGRACTPFASLPRWMHRTVASEIGEADTGVVAALLYSSRLSLAGYAGFAVELGSVLSTQACAVRALAIANTSGARSP